MHQRRASRSGTLPPSGALRAVLPVAAPDRRWWPAAGFTDRRSSPVALVGLTRVLVHRLDPSASRSRWIVDRPLHRGDASALDLRPNRVTATIDPATTAGARALERLATEKIGWLTTVNPDGQPQSSPIWFLWTDGEVVLYSHKRAPRNDNLARPPARAFNLNTDAGGGDVVTMEGRARIDAAGPPATANEPISPSTGHARRATAGPPSTSPASTRSSSGSRRPAGGWADRDGRCATGRRPGGGRCRRRRSAARAGGRAMVARTERRLCRTTFEPPFCASERARALHERAARRRPPRRFAALGPRPARRARPGPRRRARASSRATSRSRSSRRARSRRATSTSSATTTAATTSSCWRSRRAGRRRRGEACSRGRSTWRPERTRWRADRTAGSTLIRSQADLDGLPRAPRRRPGRSRPGSSRSRARTRSTTTRPTSRSSPTRASG